MQNFPICQQSQHRILQGKEKKRDMYRVTRKPIHQMPLKVLQTHLSKWSLFGSKIVNPLLCKLEKLKYCLDIKDIGKLLFLKGMLQLCL